VSFSDPASYIGDSVAPGRAFGARLSVRNRTKKRPVCPSGLLGVGRRADNPTL